MADNTNCHICCFDMVIQQNQRGIYIYILL